ncbi:MAG: hypothetical protein ACF8TS_08940 [Maioricimonas sp. JB049]
MNPLAQYDALLLGLDDHRQVEQVDLAAQLVETHVSHAADTVPA